MIGPYTIATISSATVVTVGTLLSGHKNGVPFRTCITITLSLLILMFIGSRTLYLWTNHPSTTISFLDIEAHGFSLFGGILLAITGGGILCTILRIDPWKLADSCSPYVGVGIAIMRIGCFMNGCCFGIETHLPWGVRFPLMSPSHLSQLQHAGGELLFVHPVHPTQLYELIAAILGSSLALYILRKKLPSGIAFVGFGLWFTIFRIFNSNFRVTPESSTASPFFYPFLYTCIVGIGMLYIYKRVYASSIQHP
jgi:phosphatidylglycerol:prolipoprotein diacylglycerol transferase